MYPLQPKISNYKRHAVLEGYFSQFECDAAVACAMRVPETQATISNERLTDSKVREAKLRWIGWNGDTDWLFRKIESAATILNDQVFKYDLSLIREIQFTEYSAPNGHYNWHQDIGEREMSTRKLSLVVQLTNPQEYKGGHLELFGLEELMPKTQGTVVAFPSFEFHQVLPVFEGTRRSLVIWVTGPVFR